MSFSLIWQLYCDECSEPYDQSMIESSSRRFVVTMARTEGWRFPRPAGPTPARKALCPACAVAPQMPLPVDITQVEIYSTAPGPYGGVAGIYTRERPDGG